MGNARLKKPGSIILAVVAILLLSIGLLLATAWLSNKFNLKGYLPPFIGVIFQSYLGSILLRKAGMSNGLSIFLSLVITLVGWIMTFVVIMRMAKVGC